MLSLGEDISRNPNNNGCACNNDMLLHMGVREFILFKFWKTGSPMGIFGSCLLVMLISIFYEIIDLIRSSLITQHLSMISEDSSSTGSNDHINRNNDILTYVKKTINSVRFIQTVLYGLQHILGATLILIIVSFNFWLIISVVIGKCVGYFISSGLLEVQKRAPFQNTSVIFRNNHSPGLQLRQTTLTTISE